MLHSCIAVDIHIKQQMQLQYMYAICDVFTVRTVTISCDHPSPSDSTVLQ